MAESNALLSLSLVVLSVDDNFTLEKEDVKRIRRWFSPLLNCFDLDPRTTAFVLRGEEITEINNEWHAFKSRREENFTKNISINVASGFDDVQFHLSKYCLEYVNFNSFRSQLLRYKIVCSAKEIDLFTIVMLRQNEVDNSNLSEKGAERVKTVMAKWNDYCASDSTVSVQYLSLGFEATECHKINDKFSATGKGSNVSALTRIVQKHLPDIQTQLTEVGGGTTENGRKVYVVFTDWISPWQDILDATNATIYKALVQRIQPPFSVLNFDLSKSNEDIKVEVQLYDPSVVEAFKTLKDLYDELKITEFSEHARIEVNLVTKTAQDLANKYKKNLGLEIESQKVDHCSSFIDRLESLQQQCTTHSGYKAIQSYVESDLVSFIYSARQRIETIRQKIKNESTSATTTKKDLLQINADNDSLVIDTCTELDVLQRVLEAGSSDCLRGGTKDLEAERALTFLVTCSKSFAELEKDFERMPPGEERASRLKEVQRSRVRLADQIRQAKLATRLKDKSLTFDPTGVSLMSWLFDASRLFCESLRLAKSGTQNIQYEPLTNDFIDELLATARERCTEDKWALCVDGKGQVWSSWECNGVSMDFYLPCTRLIMHIHFFKKGYFYVNMFPSEEERLSVLSGVSGDKEQQAMPLLLTNYDLEKAETNMLRQLELSYINIKKENTPASEGTTGASAVDTILSETDVPSLEVPEVKEGDGAAMEQVHESAEAQEVFGRLCRAMLKSDIRPEGNSHAIAAVMVSPEGEVLRHSYNEMIRQSSDKRSEGFSSLYHAETVLWWQLATTADYSIPSDFSVFSSLKPCNLCNCSMHCIVKKFKGHIFYVHMDDGKNCQNSVLAMEQIKRVPEPDIDQSERNGPASHLQLKHTKVFEDDYDWFSECPGSITSEFGRKVFDNARAYLNNLPRSLSTVMRPLWLGYLTRRRLRSTLKPYLARRQQAAIPIQCLVRCFLARRRVRRQRQARA